MMKPLFFLMLLVLPGALLAQDKEKVYDPVIVWEKSSHDFGDIVQGEKVEFTFKFKNDGNAPLIITNVQVTCGCTTPKGWSKDPIPPGSSSEITVGFDSAHKIGRQNKVVTIISNAANADRAGQLTFSANVIEKKLPNQ